MCRPWALRSIGGRPASTRHADGAAGSGWVRRRDRGDRKSVAKGKSVERGGRRFSIKIVRENFVDHAKIWRDMHGEIILEDLQKLGCSCDWTRNVLTLDEDCLS